MLLLEPYGYLLWGEDAFVFYIFPTHFSLALQVQFAPYPIKPADHTASHCHENGKFVYQFPLYYILWFVSIAYQYFGFSSHSFFSLNRLRLLAIIFLAKLSNSSISRL